MPQGSRISDANERQASPTKPKAPPVKPKASPTKPKAPTVKPKAPLKPATEIRAILRRNGNGKSRLLKRPTYSTTAGPAQLERMRSRATPERRLRSEREAVAQAERNLLPRLNSTRPKESALVSMTKGRGGWLAQQAVDLQGFVENTPGALVALTKAIALDVKDVAQGKPGAFDPRKPGHTAKLLKEVAVETKRRWSDPSYVRDHSALAALDVIGALSAAGGVLSRVGAAGSALAKTGSVTKATKALATKPVPPKRVHLYEGVEIQGRYSPNAFARTVQRAADAARMRRGAPLLTPPGKVPEGTISTISTRKAARLLNEQRRIETAKAQVAGTRLATEAKKMSSPKQLAVQVVAEGVPLDEVIAFELRQAARAKGKTRKGHRRMAALLEAARPYLDVENGRPVISAKYPQLRKLTERAEKASLQMDEKLIAAGLLTPEQAQFRINAPGRVMKGAKFESTRAVQARAEQVRTYPNVKKPKFAETIAKRLGGEVVSVGEDGATIRLPAVEAAPASAKLVGAEEFTAGRFRVPEMRPSKPVRTYPQAWRGGIPRKPPTLTQPYKGALRLYGQRTAEPVRALGEELLLRERLLEVMRFRERLLPMGREARPEGRNWVPVLARPLNQKERRALQRVMAEADNPSLSLDEAAVLDEALGQLRKTIFPDPRDLAVPVGQSVPGVVWVDKRLLGDTRRLFGGRIPGLDTMNDAMRGVLLYGKLGYVLPNALSNMNFNLFQQGFLAPANWIRASRLPEYLAASVDSVMGHGFARALASSGRADASAAGRFGQAVSKAVTGAGTFWGKFVDGPFRRAAFLHEARARGFKTDQQLLDLIENPRYADDLQEIAQRAKDAIVDYERLTPFEQDVVRRVLFIYPWIRGSAHYSVQFFRDHPVQAAVYEKIGRQSQEEADRELGIRPSWARGAFKVGGTPEEPFTINPAYINPLQVLSQGAALARGSFEGLPASEQLIEAAQPVLRAALEAFTQTDFFTRRKLTGGYLREFPSQLVRGTPQYLLAERALRMGDEQKNYTSPVRTPYDVLAPFVLGSAAPRRTSRAELNERALRELPREEQVRIKAEQERKELFAALRKVDPTWLTIPEDRKALVTALDRRVTMREQFREAERKYEPGIEREQDKLRREIRLAKEWGLLPPIDVKEGLRVAASGDEELIAAWRREMAELREQAYLAILREAEKAAAEARTPVAQTP